MVEKFDTQKYQKSVEGGLLPISERAHSGSKAGKQVYYDTINKRIVIHNKKTGVWWMSKFEDTQSNVVRNSDKYKDDLKDFTVIVFEDDGNIMGGAPKVQKDIRDSKPIASKEQPSVVDHKFWPGLPITAIIHGKEYTYLTRWNKETGLVEICIKGAERWQNGGITTDDGGNVEGKAKLTMWKIFGEDVKIKGLDYKDTE